MEGAYKELETISCFLTSSGIQSRSLTCFGLEGRSRQERHGREKEEGRFLSHINIFFVKHICAWEFLCFSDKIKAEEIKKFNSWLF